jgi:hypothetical protein
VAGAAVLVTIGGVGGAVAAGQITSSDIKDQTIQQRDIARGGVDSSEVENGSLGMRDLNQYTQNKINAQGEKGEKGDPGEQGEPGTPGTPGGPGVGAAYVGPNWSIVDRNVIGNGDAYLRSGPMSPPQGIGSLGLRTGAATDKAAFGDQQTFAGMLVKDITKIGFSVYNTGENIKGEGNNAPSITIEIDPNVGAAGPNYSSMVYVPQERSADANRWTTYDATTDGKWGLTGMTGTECDINGAMCTWTELQEFLNDGGEDAKITYSVQITKGRDYAWSGAVDALVINNHTYDFEPFGVHTR